MELVRIPTKELDKIWGLIEKDISWGVSTFEKLADIGLV